MLFIVNKMNDFQAMHAFMCEIDRNPYGNILLDLQGSTYNSVYSNIFGETDEPMAVYVG